MKTASRRREEFLVNATGERVAVVLDLLTYQELRDAAEDKSDIAAYRAAKPVVEKEIAAGQFSNLADYRLKRSSKRK